MSWFDSKDRAPGILSNILSEDINSLNGLTTEHFSLLLEAIISLLVGVVISMIYTWKMGLITLATCPLVALGGILMGKVSNKNANMKSKQGSESADDPYKESNALLSDILINYRTVISFGEKNMDYLLSKFDQLLEVPNKRGVKNAHLAGFFYGYSQFIRFAFIGFVFYIAAIFIFKQNDPVEDTYVGVYTLFIAALGTGMAVSSAPSASKAKEAAKTIFGIIEEPVQIDSRDQKGIKTIERGEIELKKAVFKYPSRTQPVMRKMDLKIPATKKIALVGHSGCGKSTIANLLLRMYDLTDG